MEIICIILFVVALERNVIGFTESLKRCSEVYPVEKWTDLFFSMNHSISQQNP